MPNIELLEKTMTYIKDHPEKHDQETFCGTAQCFAGWAAILSGEYDQWDWNTMEYVSESPDDDYTFAAARLLGLDIEDAYRLFAAGNTVEQLERMVKNLANGDEIEAGL